MMMGLGGVDGPVPRSPCGLWQVDRTRLARQQLAEQRRLCQCAAGGAAGTWWAADDARTMGGATRE
jgi:hypothetical protein